MFQTLKRLFLAAAVAVSCASWGAPGQALDGEGTAIPYSYLGPCQIIIYWSTTNSVAFVMLNQLGSPTPYYAGGSGWVATFPNPTGTLTTGLNPITEATLASCIGTDVSNITGLQQNGADIASFAAEDDIGFSFNYNGDRYEFAISGATGTASVAGVTGPATPVGPAGPTSEETSANLGQARAAGLLQRQPGLRRFLNGTAQNQLSAVATSTKGQFKFAAGIEDNTWTDISGAWSSTGTNSASYVLVAVGTHTFVGPDMIVGVMLQADQISASTASGTTSSSGTGWLIGPYFASRAANDPLYFEGSLLYGGASNSVNTGSVTGSFNSTRLLATLKVSGDVKYGEWTFSPHLDGAYTQENQSAYADSALSDVAARTISQGNLSLGLGFARPVPSDRGQLTFRSDISAVAIVASDDAVLNGSRSARVQVGFDYLAEDGSHLSLTVEHSGIGIDSYQSNGASAFWTKTF